VWLRTGQGIGEVTQLTGISRLATARFFVP
jgi:hypothetical protein